MGVLATLGTIAGAITALAIIGGAIVWVGRKVKPLLRMADDWHGEPERKDASGVVVAPARPGVLARLVALEQEMSPNGGLSARDAIDRIEKRLNDHLAATRVD